MTRLKGKQDEGRKDGWNTKYGIEGEGRMEDRRRVDGRKGRIPGGRQEWAMGSKKKAN